MDIIGDYTKKDNHDRLQKIRKNYIKLYEKLNTNKELGRIRNLKNDV